MRGTNTNLLNRRPYRTNVDELTNTKRFIKQDHHVSKELADGLLECKTKTKTCTTDRREHSRHRHSETLKTDQTAQNPDQSSDEGHGRSNQHLHILVARMATDSTKKTPSDLVDQPSQKEDECCGCQNMDTIDKPLRQ